MHSKIQEWQDHPVTKALLKTIKGLQEGTQQDLLNLPEDVQRDRIIRLIERTRVYTEILDLDNLLLGELDE